MAAKATSGARSPLILLLLLLLLIGLIFFALPSLNTQVTTTTQSTTEGQCQNGGKGFNAQQEAYTLAQSAEQYRTARPSGKNYGLGSYTICSKDGTGKRFQSNVFPGFWNNDDPTQPRNATHSEQSAYGWIQKNLTALSIDQSRVTAVYAVIFSQVKVCPYCDTKLQSYVQH